MILLSVADFLHVGASLILFGAAAFPFYTGGEAPSRVLRWSALAAFVFGATAILLHARVLEAAPAQLLATGIGRVWCAQVVLAGLAALLAFAPRALTLIAVLSAINVALFALVGHASAIAGWTGAGVEALHLLAAGGWIGGLVVLMLALRSDRAAEMLRRFSAAGLIAVLVIAATGAASLFLITGSALPMSAFGYGRLAFLKVALFGAALVCAALNRFFALPRGAWAVLARIVTLELALLTLVLAAAVTLAATEPLS